MSKYEPLGKYLYDTGNDNITLNFVEIEKILGFILPNYLYNYTAGWYGIATASPTHRQKVVWCSYGYQVNTVDLITKDVTFCKVR